MKKSGEIPVLEIVLGAGLLVGGYFVVKPLLEFLNIKEDPEDKQIRKDKEKSLKDWEKQISQTQRPTKSAAEWHVIADQIYDDLKFSAISDDPEDAGYQVARVKNDADFLQLFKAFGERQEYAFGIPIRGRVNLASFIRYNLSPEKIGKVNDNYRRKGIKFRF